MLRDLRTSDIFKMSKIIKKMGIKVETKDKSQEQVGADLILTVFENIHLAENEFYEFFGDLCGKTPEEFAKLPFEETLAILKKFKEIPGINTFFQGASQ